MNSNRRKWQHLAGGAVLACVVLVSGSAFGGRISDIRSTKHNLSATADGTTYTPPNAPSVSGVVPVRTVKATTETQVCVFCHTPHGATLGLMPLWNRKLSSATYTYYTSSSLDAEAIQGANNRQPGGSSKLCLSCHDGTLAIGSVNVLNGLGSVTQQQSITMTGVVGASGVMASGDGTTTGYTRNLGIDLTNDHPISVTYNKSLADRDGELRGLDATTQKDTDTTGTIIGIRSSGYRPKAPLEPTGASSAGQVQCSACHDPHIRETDATVGNQKFLTLNRFQATNTAPTVFDSTKDISCVACHDKNNANGVWVYSAHANNQVATQTYTNNNGAAAQREFPKAGDCTGCTDLPVWKASCLNCHDTHTVSGSRWLLREGTDNAASPKAGGNSAIEETCYQCHSSSNSNANIAITPPNGWPDIKADFALTYHMPVNLADQQAGASSPNSPTYPATEAHDIGGTFNDGGYANCSYSSGTPGANNLCGADFVEERAKLGAGTDNPPTSGLTNRHAECTDCHNPHRVVKFNSFLGANGSGSLSGAGDSTGSTHKHTDTDNYTHTNIASGALRGTFGVEPVYGSTSFSAAPSTISYTVKRGDPGASNNSAVGAAWVTREYQICLKCHSNYGYDETNYVADASSGPTRPKLPTSSSNGLTTSSQSGGLYNLYYYTNQAQEFQASSFHMGETSGVSPSNTSYPGGASAVYQTSPQTNHRSWHPVMDVTGRTLAIRAASGVAFNLPWRNNGNAVGAQTMYCDDCHGSNVSSATSVIPDNADITRRAWGPHGSGNPFILKDAWDSSSSALCLKCHDANTYTLGVAAAAAAGGGGTGFMTNLGDGHQLHVDKIGSSKCNWCHVAVPHGWKNKALLVNLNDIGPEAGQTAGTEVQILAASSVPNNGYNKGPYYMNARLKVLNFKASGQWTANDCGSRGTAPGTGNGEFGLRWMAASGVVPGADYTENCQTPP